MKKDYSISVYLDTRREKKDGTFPVKLRVFNSNIRKQKLYSTPYSFTQKEFDSIWNTQKPKKEFKDLQLEIQALENRSNNVAKELQVFTFEQFERKLKRKKGDGVKVLYHYNQKIADLKKQKRFSTADSYKYSQNAISEYIRDCFSQSFHTLSFFNIDQDWLLGFEDFMESSGRSLTTIGIYLRPLKAIFNKAISENDIDKDIYPFGKNKYVIPSSSKVKKALNKEQLKQLFEATPQTFEQEKAKDYWFFSYNCNGINIKDIALLKYKDLNNSRIEFYRAKTIRTSKSDLKLITVHLNQYIEDFIQKYGNPNKQPENYIFNILEANLTPEQQYRKIKNFTRFINQHIKKLCQANDLPQDISFYWARHSFATYSLRKGASLEFMQESLGHKDKSTTLNYFAGFDNEQKKVFADSLMDFTS